jgi:hypothetical protein
MQYSYRFLALNIMAQTCSPCSIHLCGKTVTKTRLDLNTEVMVVIIIIIIIQLIYLCAWQQPDMANYSQAQKQQYSLTLKKQTKT